MSAHGEIVVQLNETLGPVPQRAVAEKKALPARGQVRAMWPRQAVRHESEAKRTSLCAYLSAIALGGVALNMMVGWWWADALAALAMVPIIVREVLEGIRGEACCDDCAPGDGHDEISLRAGS